jgi:signal transduction histidine kinase
LLLLAAAEEPDFLHRRPMEVEPILVQALQRWSPVPRQWRLGPTDEAVVDADQERLALAIDALVENAVKHTTPGDRIELSVVRRHHQVEIGVVDSGAGILKQDLDRVFERFARSETSRRKGIEGTGLGLSIVKTIAEAHGGGLQARSQPGSGSQFILMLPEALPRDSSMPMPMPMPLA